MAKYPNITLTNEGLNMIAQSQGNGQLIFTLIKIGDGSLTNGEDIKALKDLKNVMLTANISSLDNSINGQITLNAIINNTGVATGFFARELGVYAKVGDNGVEKLYAYTNAGNYGDYMPDENTPIDENQIKITLIVGNASNVTAIINSSIVYATMETMNKTMQEHNESANSHTQAFTQHNESETAHPDLRDLIKKAGGVSIGTITPRLSLTPEPGELACDTGALVSRATYRELWTWVQAKAPLITESAWQAQAAAQSSVGYYSSGDGSTTFRLPRIVDYARGGLATEVGTWQGDAIRNITGEMTSNIGETASTFSGAFKQETYTNRTAANVTPYLGVGKLEFDASLVVPTANENRPKTIKFLYCVKAFDAPTNQGMIDITELANEVAGKQKAIQFIQIVDEKPTGTAGGVFASGAWRTRMLNTIRNNDGNNATLNTNQITLPAGTYIFEGYAPAGYVDGHQCRLQNITDGTTIAYGSNANCSNPSASATDNIVTVSQVSGKFTITGTKTFELQHYSSSSSAATGGFGAAVSAASGVEVYAQLKIWKVG